MFPSHGHLTNDPSEGFRGQGKSPHGSDPSCEERDPEGANGGEVTSPLALSEAFLHEPPHKHKGGNTNGEGGSSQGDVLIQPRASSSSNRGTGEKAQNDVSRAGEGRGEDSESLVDSAWMDIVKDARLLW